MWLVLCWPGGGAMPPVATPLPLMLLGLVSEVQGCFSLRLCSRIYLSGILFTNNC